jgi:hypothetical protein
MGMVRDLSQWFTGTFFMGAVEMTRSRPKSPGYFQGFEDWVPLVG